MTTYGTIPPVTSDPQRLDFISRAKLLVQSALAARRPVGEMVHTHAFSLPSSLGDAYLRIRANAAYFCTNYAILVLLVIFLGLLWHPVSLVVFVLTIGAWLVLHVLRDQPLVLLGRPIDDSHVVISLSVGTIVLLVLTNAAANILGLMCSGLAVILLHAALRKTDDLAVEEEAMAAGEWYAVVGGDARKPSSAA
ncbi:hypothetical protein HPP92_002492 [Vanilla planifolia]|uniref:PRA1 family protein n=1 Tax=Vanilla planifolia TaxID=51239 RepID=A0A835VMF0_VANPL|nr:hypothetical protein HPP92_002492 [Vanilla planifolia]